MSERALWRKKIDFVEFAEAVKVTTEQVMAVRNPESDTPIVLFTRDDAYPPLIYGAMLRRDEDGILRVASEKEIPGMWEEITKALNELNQ